MSERAAAQAPGSDPRPTRRQLVIRAIGTALVLGALVVGLAVVLDARNEPVDVTEFRQDPRTVSYGRLSLQIPAEWDLADVDDCGYVQGDTLILGLAGAVTCAEGERDPEASDVVMSSLTGQVVAPAPTVRLLPVTLPSGLRAERGSTRVPTPADVGDEEGDVAGDVPPLRTTVLRIPSLDAQVVATSPDPQLVDDILNSAKRVPVGSPATTTVAYLTAALDVPRTWAVNAVDCGVPITDTVIAGHPGKPRLTARSDRTCQTRRPPGVTNIYLDSLDSAFGRRWGVLASDPVTLLGGVKGLRGTKALPDGLGVTVVLVPDLRAIAVARSADQALVDTVLSTVHRAVPVPPDEDPPTPSPSPEPTARPTLPAGVETRTVRYAGLALAVPSRWSDEDLRCGVPQSDTVVLGAPGAVDLPCTPPTRPAGVSELVIDHVYGDFGSQWRAVAVEPITLPSGLSGLRGTTTNPQGLPVTVLAFPTMDVLLVATVADGAAAQSLVDGILTTTRAID